MAKNHRYRITIRVIKEITRTVYATTENKAVASVKRKIAAGPIKISTRNFEEYPTVLEDPYFSY
jgi:hypothetical protein